MSAQGHAASGVDLSTLNERQLKIATTLDAPLFVEAGAGSGKTFTLTQRVAWALSPGSGADGAPFLDALGQVLVITFTEAAAREIKERVRSTLRRAQMGEAALAVDEAWISTIHGMCSRILHRYALDLGLDPSFTVAGTSQAQALFDGAMDSVMRAARADESFSPLFDAFDLGVFSPSGYTGAMGVVERLVRKGRSLVDGLDGLAPAPSDPRALGELVCALAARMEELGACKLTPKALEKVVPALEAVRACAGHAPGALVPEEVAATLAGVSLPRSSKAIADELAAVKSALALARGEAEFLSVAPLADAFLELARRVEARYDELKLAEGCLDNDDLVRRALLAVRDNEQVRAAFEGRFRLVMVDEFQDTDEMQLSLISLLAGEGGRHLCTVGDAQQSIYRFRGADVGVFRGRGEGVDEAGTVRLDTNYRSHADVLALVERVSAGRTGAPGTMTGFMHLDHNPGRKDAYKARDLPRIDLEVVSGNGSADARADALASQVADALARYRDHGEKPGDMALLLGATTRADRYIDAIRARGMECVVTGGSTFTSTDEVKVVRALLHVLANPADTQSGLFPLLASEVFGLDATDFCELGTRTQDKLDAPTKRSIERGLMTLELYGGHVPSARLTRAHEVLVRALDEVRWRPVADVLADVVRASGWLARLEAGGAEGLARAANVLAAVRYVRDLTCELGLGAARAATEFDLWLAASKIAPASLAAAEGEGGAGTVRVMTIHASKGLEFPVCAVAECWSNPRIDSGIALGPVEDGACRFVIRPKEVPKLDDIDPEELVASADRSRQLPLAARFRATLDADAEAEAEEKARLLYVALTRAREALVVGVSAPWSKAGVSYQLSATALEALDVDPLAEGESFADYGGSEPARVFCTVVEKAAPGTGDEDEAEVPTPAPEPFDLYEVEPEPAGVAGTWRAREGVFSYSSVHALLEAKAPGARAGVPAQDVRAAEDEGAPACADADRATNLGSAFHQLAQAMVESGRAPSDRQVLAAARLWNLSERALARLRVALARWEGSDIRAEALGWDVVRAEVPFFQGVESEYGDYLEGAIDLLATDAEGSKALVVDYKTGDAGLTPDEVRARHALQAEFYAGVLLREGFSQVSCAFVCVERDDPDAPGQPLVARYSF